METTNFILSIITAFAAILALFISVHQIVESNRQSLFDRRLTAYLAIKWMHQLCINHQSLYKRYINDINNGPVYTIDFLFNMMTNNADLEDIQGTINHCLENEWQRTFLLKMSKLENLNEEIKLVFPTKNRYVLADFIYCYQEMLNAMYKYQVAINGISKECKESNIPFPKDNRLEVEQRNFLRDKLVDTFELANQIDVKNILVSLNKKIKI